MSGIMMIIFCCIIDAIYVYDMQVNDNMRFAFAKTNSLEEYIALAGFCTALYFCCVVMFTLYIPIFHKPGLVGYSASLVFWSSLVCLIYSHSMLNPSSTKNRCNSICDFYSLNNGHYYNINMIATCFIIISLTVIWKASKNIDNSNLHNWMFLWYILYPILNWFLFVLVCFNPNYTDNAAHNNNEHMKILEQV